MGALCAQAFSLCVVKTTSAAYFTSEFLLALWMQPGKPNVAMEPLVSGKQPGGWFLELFLELSGAKAPIDSSVSGGFPLKINSSLNSVIAYSSVQPTTEQFACFTQTFAIAELVTLSLAKAKWQLRGGNIIKESPSHVRRGVKSDQLIFLHMQRKVYQNKVTRLSLFTFCGLGRCTRDPVIAQDFHYMSHLN